MKNVPKERISFGITVDKKFIGWHYEEDDSVHRQFYRIDQITGIYVHTFRKLMNENREKPKVGVPRDPAAKTEWVTIHQVSINVLGSDGGATLDFFDEEQSSAFVGLCLGDLDTIARVDMPKAEEPKA